MAKRVGSSSFHVDYSGAFFDRDPVKTVQANIAALMETIATEGERDVRGRIEASRGAMPHSTGHTARAVRGRVVSLSGRRWKATAVVSANTAGMGRKQAIRTKAAAASVEARFHPFRRATAAIRSGARNAAKTDLAKGLE